MGLNSVTEGHLSSLMCIVRDRFEQLIEAIEEKGYGVIVTQSYRSKETQARLYNDPKYHKSSVAKPGTSRHQFRIAVDINLKKDKKLWKKDTPREEWVSTGIPELAKSLGFRWGGEFSKYDPIHFDLDNDFQANKLTGQLNYLKDIPLSTGLSCVVEEFMKRFTKSSN
jgi:hypothetical protein